jgi:hypothetical protein
MRSNLSFLLCNTQQLNSNQTIIHINYIFFSKISIGLLGLVLDLWNILTDRDWALIEHSAVWRHKSMHSVLSIIRDNGGNARIINTRIIRTFPLRWPGLKNSPTVTHAWRQRRLKRVPSAWGYSWATLSPGVINTKAWSSRSGVGRWTNNPAL